MENISIKEKIIEQIEKLNPEQQKQILNFAKVFELGKSKGVKGKELLRFSGAIEKSDLDIIVIIIIVGYLIQNYLFLAITI